MLVSLLSMLWTVPPASMPFWRPLWLPKVGCWQHRVRLPAIHDAISCVVQAFICDELFIHSMLKLINGAMLRQTTNRPIQQLNPPDL